MIAATERCWRWTMLHELRRKVPPSGQIQVVAGKGTRLPFAGGHFDGVMRARVLYRISAGQVVLRQTCDILKPEGCLFHEWGKGEAG